jgi:L-rhamnose mutarotase
MMPAPPATLGPEQPESPVVRIAFRMAVHPGRAAEYERRHNPIWTELGDTLLRHGVRSYSIYLDPETHDLFGYVEVDDEQRWEAIAATDVCQRWWRSMQSSCEPMDNSPVSARCAGSSTSSAR